MKKYSSVDEYVADFPPKIREILDNLRRVIKESVHGVEESISYGMPGFKLDGKSLVYFAAWKKHIGFYGASSAFETFQADLAPFKILKGTIQFPLDKPIPMELIGKIVKFRIAEVLDGDSLEKPPFDLKQAKEMIGKCVLIGVTYYDHKGEFVEQKQMYGIMSGIDAQRGLEFKLQGSHTGEFYRLPPDLRSFNKAQPGTYRLHSTGEEVVNPDYLTTWVINKAAPGPEAPK
jgi:uncharacterized protein YdhG (YjbR/CyaY superfamily)